MDNPGEKSRRRYQVLNGTFLTEYGIYSCPVYEWSGLDCTGCKCTYGFDYGDAPICRPINTLGGTDYAGFYGSAFNNKNCDEIIADGSFSSVTNWGVNLGSDSGGETGLLNSCTIIDKHAFTAGHPRENFAEPFSFSLFGPCWGCRSCIQCAQSPYEGPCLKDRCIELWTDHLRSCGCDGSASCDSAHWNQWNEWECATKYGQQHFACGEN